MTNTSIDLERSIRELRLPELGDTTIATHAVVQTIDPHTVAVVVFSGHNTPLIERAIREQHKDIADIASANDVITITVR